MLATADSGWWQTTWPIISAPLFLIIGIFGTIATGAYLERSRASNAKATRTHEWQRQNLIDLQDIGSHVTSEAMDLVSQAQIAAKFDGVDYADVLSEEARRPILRKLDDAHVLSSRALDEQVRSLSMALIDTLAGALLSSSASTADEWLDKSGSAFRDSNRRIGELLRSDYA